MSKEIWILIVSILILAIIGLAFLIHQAPAIGWILSILFWIGVIRYWNKKKQLTFIGQLFFFSQYDNKILIQMRQLFSYYDNSLLKYKNVKVGIYTKYT